MVLFRFTSKEFLYFGLDLAGFSSYTIRRNEKKMNLERFKDTFYASPQTSENIFVAHLLNGNSSSDDPMPDLAASSEY